jgi:hypothetical protein
LGLNKGRRKAKKFKRQEAKVRRASPAPDACRGVGLGLAVEGVRRKAEKKFKRQEAKVRGASLAPGGLRLVGFGVEGMSAC